MFKALVLRQQDNQTIARLETFEEAVLPAGDVLVDVSHSSLNYKDALAITGKGKIVREYPFVPGIDFVGTVRQSNDSRFSPGDLVVLTGWGVGERHWGGMAERARVKGDWLLPLPDGFDAFRAMALGTAGLTAMLAVMTLEEAGVTPERGAIVVTGASGGVGSFAIALLHRLGYQIAAVTGRSTSADYLTALGASEIVSRDQMNQPPKPLEAQRWGGAIDTVGGTILARILAEAQYGGCVAACGLAADYHLETTVMPFILRGVSLRGVDSVYCPNSRRAIAWERLASLVPNELYTTIATEIPLSDTIEAAQALLRGEVRGRLVVNTSSKS